MGAGSRFLERVRVIWRGPTPLSAPTRLRGGPESRLRTLPRIQGAGLHGARARHRLRVRVTQAEILTEVKTIHKKLDELKNDNVFKGAGQAAASLLLCSGVKVKYYVKRLLEALKSKREAIDESLAEYPEGEADYLIGLFDPW